MFLAVIFTPIGNGTRTATLTVTDNAVMSPQTVSLTGTATGDFAITASPTALTVVAEIQECLPLIGERNASPLATNARGEHDILVI